MVDAVVGRLRQSRSREHGPRHSGRLLRFVRVLGWAAVLAALALLCLGSRRRGAYFVSAVPHLFEPGPEHEFCSSSGA